MNKDNIIDHEDKYYTDKEEIIFEHGHNSGIALGLVLGLGIGTALGVFISYYYL